MFLEGRVVRFALGSLIESALSLDLMSATFTPVLSVSSDCLPFIPRFNPRSGLPRFCSAEVTAGVFSMLSLDFSGRPVVDCWWLLPFSVRMFTASVFFLFCLTGNINK